LSPAAAVLALIALLFSLGAAIIAIFGRNSRELWRVYASTICIAAAVLVPAAIHPLLFMVIVAIAAVRCGIEIAAIYGVRMSPLAIASLAAMISLAGAAGDIQATGGAGWFMSAGAALLVLLLPAVGQALLRRPGGMSVWTVALGLPVLFAGSFAYLASRMDGFLWIFVLYATVETQDSIAFLAGRLIGHRPLAKRLSPRKTVEGAVAGAIAGCLIGTVAVALLLGLTVTSAAAIAASLVIAGLLGDFTTSRLKRVAGVKDFPSVHALHGGLMDIYDSTLFAAVALSFGLCLATRAN
jgi:phosphatidate cytidylyltransferase